MEINFITSNKGKLKEFQEILGDEVIVNHVEMEYDEIRSDSSEEIAKSSAEVLANELKKDVVVEDSGLFIEALNGFPGTCSAYIHKRIGLDGITKLMKGVENRKCSYKSAVAYCRSGERAVIFSGDESGSVADEAVGNFGFGHDPIFIPENSEKTYGEMGEEFKKFRKIAVDKLKKYLLDK